MLQIWEDQLRADEKSSHLSPVIPIVFYTRQQRWTASWDFRALVEGPPELLKFAPRFDILHLSLPETPPASLESIGPLGWVLRALQGGNADPPKFAPVLRRAVDAISPLFGDEWRELIEFLLKLVKYVR